MNSITEIEDSAEYERLTMLKRVITGTCIIAALIPILIFSDTWLFPCVIAVISAMCIYELAHCMGMHKRIAVTAPLYIFAVAFPFLQRLSMFENDVYIASLAIIAVIFYVAYLFGCVIFSRGKITYPEICTLGFSAFYILFALNLVIYIRDYNGYAALLILIGAWVTDTMAYFTGRLFGKHKLAPDISPKKTIEGSIGGSIFCAIAFVLLGVIVSFVVPESSPNYIYLAVSGLVISVISQAGDLIMSAMKRHYGIKDFGNILPGHGGMLDRMDSMLAVSLGIEVMVMFTFMTGISLF